MRVEANPESFCKCVLHSVKYSTQPVLGALLGKKLADSFFIVDSVPLFHTSVVTTPHPLFEVALMQATAQAKTKGLSVVGLYAANERLDDNMVSVHAKRLIGALLERQAPLVFWQLDNQKLVGLSNGVDNVPLEQLLFTNGVDSASTPEFGFAMWDQDACCAKGIERVSPARLIEAAVDQSLHAHLYDFEDHLENVSLDYFNEALNASLKSRK